MKIIKQLNQLYFALGWLSLALGILGAVLPLLPTTPFVILAALLFSKSNKKYHDWLRNHRYFGASLKNWEDHKVIPLKAKILSSSMMAISYHYSIKHIPDTWSWVKVALGAVMLSTSVYIWKQKSKIYCRHQSLPLIKPNVAP